MITRADIDKLSLNSMLEHKKLKNADGSPQRYRVNGKTKTWVTRPDDFKVPVKRGLKECGYVIPANAHNFYVVSF